MYVREEEGDRRDGARDREGDIDGERWIEGEGEESAI